jgi:progesterone-induced-blocking factor 1
LSFKCNLQHYIAGRLRMKAMELERVTMLHGESASQVKVARLECEMLTKKVRLLEGQYHSLEAAANRRQGDAEMRLAEQAARLEHYEALERELDDAVLTAAGSSGSDGEGTGGVGGERAGTALAALGSSVPASLRRRLQQSIALGRRVNELEKQCSMACDSRDAAMAKVEGLEAQLRRATARAGDAAQPYNYLAERISAAESDADAAAGREREARADLQAGMVKLAAAREEADALRRWGGAVHVATRSSKATGFNP